MNSADIQFTGPSCGHHGPYSFYKAFSYRHRTSKNHHHHHEQNGRWRSITLGQFFYARVLPGSSVCVGELQLVWESSAGTPGQMLASVKLYFRPEDTPSGRESNHGQDELLVVKDKFVIEIVDLVKWIVDIDDIPPGWPSHGCQSSLPNKECDRPTRQVCIVSYPQYCRYQATMKRLALLDGEINFRSLELAVIRAVGGPMSTLGFNNCQRKFHVMFCRTTFSYPDIESHAYRKESLAPKLKGRKRRKLKNTDGEGAANEQRTETRLKKINSVTAVDEQKPQTTGSCSKDLLKKGKDPFEKQLFKFMKDKKTPIKRRPFLGFKEVDLFNFFSLAHKFGGYDKITEDRLWKQIYDQLGGHAGNTSAATCTRRIYEKLLLAFERHVRGQDDIPVPAPYLRPSKPVRRPRSSTSVALESLGDGILSNGVENSNSMDQEISNCSSSTTAATSVDEQQISSPSSNSSSKRHKATTPEKKHRKHRHHADKQFKFKRLRIDEDVENQSSWSAVSVPSAVNDNVVCKVILKNCRRMSLQTPTNEVSESRLSPVTTQCDVVTKAETDVVPVVPISDESSKCEQLLTTSKANDAPTAAVYDVEEKVSQPKVESGSENVNNACPPTVKLEPVAAISHPVVPALLSGEATKPLASVELVKPLTLVESNAQIITEIKAPTPVECHQMMPNRSLISGLLVCSSSSPAGMQMTPSLVNFSSVCSTTGVISPLVSRFVVGPSMPNFQPRLMPPSSNAVVSIAAPTPMVNVEGTNWSYPLLNGGTWLALAGPRPPSTVVADMQQPVRLGVLPMFGLSNSSTMTTPGGLMMARPERPCLTSGYRLPVVSCNDVAPRCAAVVSQQISTSGISTVGLSSPIKQFIDRTRIVCPLPVTSGVPSHAMNDDGPADMSMKTLRRMELESLRSGIENKLSDAAASVSSIDDRPLDLCMKVTLPSRTTFVSSTVTISMPPTVSSGHRSTQQNGLLQTPTHGPILTVPMCFAPKSSAASMSMPLTGAGTRIIVPSIVPSARQSLPNGSIISPLPSNLSRSHQTLNLPIMHLQRGSYSSAQSNFAILHPAFQLSPTAALQSPMVAAGSTVPLSPATPVIATLSPFIGSPFLMTQLGAAAVPSAGINDGHHRSSSSELRK